MLEQTVRAMFEKRKRFFVPWKRELGEEAWGEMAAPSPESTEKQKNGGQLISRRRFSPGSVKGAR
jgi:hypothetical protein